MTNTKDLFISYGRRESLNFSGRLHREHAHIHTVLQQRATEWHDKDRIPDFLLNKAACENAEKWLTEADVETLNLQGLQNLVGLNNGQLNDDLSNNKTVERQPSQQFSHFFNSYSNKKQYLCK